MLDAVLAALPVLIGTVGAALAVSIGRTQLNVPDDSLVIQHPMVLRLLSVALMVTVIPAWTHAAPVTTGSRLSVIAFYLGYTLLCLWLVAESFRRRFAVSQAGFEFRPPIGSTKSIAWSSITSITHNSWLQSYIVHTSVAGRLLLPDAMPGHLQFLRICRIRAMGQSPNITLERSREP
jgi:hypothetical protein